MEDHTKQGNACFEKVLLVEKALCGMGDGWGRISKGEYLLLWWLLRHGLYAAATVLLIIYFPASLNLIIIIILFIHLYKLIRFAFYFVYDKRNKRIDEDVSPKESTLERFDEESG